VRGITPAAFELALRSTGVAPKSSNACFISAALLFCVSRSFALIQVVHRGRSGTVPGLSPRRRFGEHGFVRDPHLLRSCALSNLFGSAATLRDDRSQRPELRGRNHVGARFARFPDTRRVIAIQYLSPGHFTRATTKDGFQLDIGFTPLPVRSSTMRSALFGASKPLTPATNKRFDLLTVPMVGTFLRAQSGRRVLQASLLVIAVAVVVDGISDPKSVP